MKRHMPNQSDLSNYGRLLGVMLITAAIAVVVFYFLFGLNFGGHF